MGALPKRKISKGRKHRRRTHHGKDLVATAKTRPNSKKVKGRKFSKNDKN